MWIVKLGGSLLGDPLLAEWLRMLSQLGGGRVTIVCGGGRFADEVRRAQSHWQFDDLAAHNMAVLAMAQTAWLVHGLQPDIELVTGEADVRRVLHAGHVAAWLPFDCLRTQADEETNWDFTSDSIALELARRLNAERLVVVKSCEVDRRQSFEQLGEEGVVDARFAAGARGAAFPIDLVHKAELAAMRSLLIGEVGTLRQL